MKFFESTMNYGIDSDGFIFSQQISLYSCDYIIYIKFRPMKFFESTMNYGIDSDAFIFSQQISLYSCYYIIYIHDFPEMKGHLVQAGFLQIFANLQISQHWVINSLTFGKNNLCFSKIKHVWQSPGPGQTPSAPKQWKSDVHVKG